MRDALTPPAAAPSQKPSAVVAATLGRLALPITKERALRDVGNSRVSLDGETTLELRSILSSLPPREFTDAGRIARAADERWVRLARTLQELEAAQHEAERKRRR